MFYINRRSSELDGVQTVEEFEKKEEALSKLNNYIKSDRSSEYSVSTRADSLWRYNKYK